MFISYAQRRKHHFVHIGQSNGIKTVEVSLATFKNLL